MTVFVLLLGDHLGQFVHLLTPALELKLGLKPEQMPVQQPHHRLAYCIVQWQHPLLREPVGLLSRHN